MHSSAVKKLFLVKLVHTVIWAFYVLVIGYILYAGVWGEIGPAVWIANGLVILEGVILAVNKWRCPMTLIGARYSSSTADNFDIFLPAWLARNNKVIFTTIYFCALLIVVLRIIRG